jgi:hypothetical protein
MSSIWLWEEEGERRQGEGACGGYRHVGAAREALHLTCGSGQGDRR